MRRKSICEIIGHIQMKASEKHELFSDITNNFVRDDLEDIEVDSLG